MRCYIPISPVLLGSSQPLTSNFPPSSDMVQKQDELSKGNKKQLVEPESFFQTRGQNGDPEVLLAWADTDFLRQSLPDDNWGAEEYEDLAITLASMYSLLLPTQETNYAGRLVVAAEIPAAQISTVSASGSGTGKTLPEMAFASIELAKPVTWSQIVSIHLEPEETTPAAIYLRDNIRPDNWEFLLFDTVESDPDSAEKLFGTASQIVSQQWDILYNQALAWFDISEKAALWRQIGN